MRPLELLLVAATAAGLLRWLLPHRVRAGWVVAGVVAGVAALHVAVEGARWQLAPAYLVAAGVVAMALRGAPTGPTWVRATGRVAGALGLVLAVGLGVVLPVLELPPTTGDATVGRVRWEVVDDSREERYGDAPGGPRRLLATAWYPTDAAPTTSPWIHDAGPFATEVGGQIGLPGLVLSHIGLVEDAVVGDAPVAAADQPLPVVVYSHGWGGFADVQSDLATELASHGFVVVALDHTFGAAVTTFPDGTVAPLDPAANPEAADVGPVERQAAIERLEATFADDVDAVLDQLAAGSGPTPLAGGVLDLDRVGLSGHSTGGGAAVRFCLTDDRCAGVLGLDPWLEPVPEDLRAPGLDVPVLSIRSEDWQGDANDQLVRRLHDDSAGDAGMLVVPGARHRDFTLLPFLTPLATRLGLSGEVDAPAMHDAVDRLALAFFDRVLRDGGDELPDLAPTVVSDR